MNKPQKGFLAVTLLVLVALILIISVGAYTFNHRYSEIATTTVKNINDNTNTVVTTGNVLNLSGQSLTKAPDYIFNQTATEELNLSNNAIGGALQSQIGKLQNLKVLNLSNNKFTGVPAEIGQLRNLEVLNLSNNTITGLPNELGNLSKLRLLDLSGNNYSETDLAGIKARLPASTVIKTK